MIFSEFQEKQLSRLGFGAMRLPVKSDGTVDESLTEKMVAYAMEQGINYYDTAWGYHDGQSEVVMGKVLNQYPRESYYIATKFPGYDLSNMNKVKEIFPKQLEKTGMEYFDFYLTGGVYRTSDWIECGGLKPSIKLTFWYEYLLRATNKGQKVYVIPKLGYKHYLNRPQSLLDIYTHTVDEKESKWWYDLSKEEFIHKEDRNKTYDPNEIYAEKDGEDY